MITASGAASDTITITPSDMSYSYNTTYDFGGSLSTVTVAGAAAQPTYSIGSSGISTITLTGGEISPIYDFHKEWQNCFPQWTRVQDMCEQYPGLKIAFENFKVFYEMVKDDYDNPTPKK